MASLVCRPGTGKGRPGRISWAQGFAFGTYLIALALSSRANAQPRDTRASAAAPQQQSARRARTVHANRADLVREAKPDYGADLDGPSFADGNVDIGVLEKRIRDLSDKVRELSEVLQRQREQHGQVQVSPMRFTLLEQHRPVVLPDTYGEAVSTLVRQRARGIRAAFGDPEKRKHLAIDPDSTEVDRLLEPARAWLEETGTPMKISWAQLRAFIYVVLLEARAGIDPPETLPAAHKLLRDLHLDRDAVTEHLRRSFLLDQVVPRRELGAVLAATATNYPEPASVRDFLKWLADSVGADLETEFLRKAAYPYRADPAGQFDAASENATYDNGAVLKLQIELQRMLTEAKALRATDGVDERTVGRWQHRLLSAERNLDLLLRAADSEREAVMTLVRRAPVARPPVTVSERLPEPAPIEPPERLASDDLTTQH